MIAGSASALASIAPGLTRARQEAPQLGGASASHRNQRAETDPERTAGPDGLSPAERAQRDALAARDREVRAHEQAHAIVGGRYAGKPSYEYEQGPDNRRYAVAGEVPIDTAPVKGDPEETIAKMQIVAAAALAPAKPSAQDRAVAALARAQQIQAQAELSAQKRAEAGLPAEGVSRRV